MLPIKNGTQFHFLPPKQRRVEWVQFSPNAVSLRYQSVVPFLPHRRYFCRLSKGFVDSSKGFVDSEAAMIIWHNSLSFCFVVTIILSALLKKLSSVDLESCDSEGVTPVRRWRDVPFLELENHQTALTRGINEGTNRKQDGRFTSGNLRYW